ncbi:MAG TPA: sugar ABC transporter ATP-binding protein [Vicinamibacterales bacterium]|nr:sugar ABC transporter ATP-binding protein [Vicinamibacterales bacterium]
MYLLEASAISKSFDGVQALRGVSFDLRAGEVHALVGENGAGKSTLIKIVTGAEVADSGTLTLSGRTVHALDPAGARALGVAAIYQQPALFPDLTVAENIALPVEGGRAWRRVDWNARRRRARQLFEQIGAAIDPERRAETLSMPERQLVEIARAIDAAARILIMDEPTASLTDREIEHLLEVVGRLRAQGTGIVYISHKLEEIFAIADRVTVLRDGQSIATRPRSDLDRAELVRLMVGRDPTALYGVRHVPGMPDPPGTCLTPPGTPGTWLTPRAVGGPVALELRAISNRVCGVRQVSLTVARGEILGVAGLVGSGRTELAETIFGLTPPDSGEVLINGAGARIAEPADAIRLGIAYVPEDRQRHGVIADLSVAVNITLNNLSAVSTRGLIDAGAERRAAARYVEQLRIKTRSVDAAVGGLSGGNQQKVALARWLSIQPSMLILDEPTQGIDVGAKAEIHGIMRELTSRGVAILMISSDLPELLAMADRVAVMRRGAIAGILRRDEATSGAVMALALGHAA